jgi:hypothetical protein
MCDGIKLEIFFICQQSVSNSTLGQMVLKKMQFGTEKNPKTYTLEEKGRL